MSETLAYLGPEGTYTWEAALKFDSSAELFPCNSIRDVIQLVLRGEVSKGIVPIENSLEGTVNVAADLLIHSQDRPMFCGEVVLPIRHSLLAKPGTTIKDIRVVASHAQALAQCRNFIEAKLHHTVVEVEALSTMAAVKDMMQADETKGAAIASARAAKLYGVSVLQENIEDISTNTTRFIVLGLKGLPPTGYDKTSMCFRFERGNKPGILYTALGVFAQRGINLTKIESRPARTGLGDYIFLVDADGHIRETSMREALDELVRVVSQSRVFGSYPKAEVLT